MDCSEEEKESPESHSKPVRRFLSYLIRCTRFGFFGRDTRAFKRLNAQVVSSTLVLEESIHFGSQISSHQLKRLSMLTMAAVTNSQLLVQ